MKREASDMPYLSGRRWGNTATVVSGVVCCDVLWCCVVVNESNRMRPIGIQLAKESLSYRRLECDVPI